MQGPMNEALSLREMLADPVVRAVMSRDGLAERDIVVTINNARRRLVGGESVLRRRPETDASSPGPRPDGSRSI